jgi:DNA-binding winged helix-turn-helix (wHTH) protein/tetratricopeptide (TPR) repeat protein
MEFPVFRFGAYALDPAARELLHEGARVALPPKSFDCLAYLVQHRARAVGRDELISAVWGRADVNDALLAQTLLRARRAVGDTGNEQTAIRTVPRFGYRWIAPIEEINTANIATIPAATPSPVAIDIDEAADHEAPGSAGMLAQHDSLRPRALAAITAVLALCVLVLAGWWWQRQAAKPSNPIADLVVVAPVTLESTNTETAWVRLGIMDYIASRLREDGQLTVLPSQRVVGLIAEGAGNAVDSRERLMNVTGAATLIEPSARQQAGGWRISLTLHANGRTHVVVGDGNTPLAAAGQASDALLVHLGRATAHAAAAPPDALSENVQRLDAAMLEGNLAVARTVIAGWPEALRDDPQLRVREGQVLFRAGRIDDADHVFIALEARLTTLPIDVQAQTLMGLGAVAVRRADFAGAERRYAEALAVLGTQGSHELSGNGYGGRGVARAAQGKFDLALADFSRARIALERAGDIPGVASVDTNLGLLESRRGQWTQSLQAFDRAINVFERYGVTDRLAASLLGKSRAQVAMVDHRDALTTSARASELARKLENPVLVGNIADLRAEILLKTGALTAAATLLEHSDDHPDSANSQALHIELELARGNPEAALKLAQASHARAPTGQTALWLVRAALAGAPADASVRNAIETTSIPADDARASASLELARALWQAAHAEPDHASESFERALARTDREVDPDLRVDVISSYIDFLVGDQRLDRASELAGQIAAYADRDYRAARASATLYRALGDQSLLASAQAHLRAVAGERDPVLPY